MMTTFTLMKNQNGFTLIELMITISIVAIVLTVAIPSFNKTVANNRLTTHLNDFIASANYARSEAVKRGARITMCPSANASTCTAGWQNGWLIFIDANTDGQRNGDPIDTILRVHSELEGTNISFQGLTSASGTNNYISFNSQGLTKKAGGGILSGELRLCDSQGNDKALGINVTGGGQVRAVEVGTLQVLKTCSY